MSSLLQLHDYITEAPIIIKMSKCVAIKFDNPISILLEGGIQIQIAESRAELIELMRNEIERGNN